MLSLMDGLVLVGRRMLVDWLMLMNWLMLMDRLMLVNCFKLLGLVMGCFMLMHRLSFVVHCFVLVMSRLVLLLGSHMSRLCFRLWFGLSEQFQVLNLMEHQGVARVKRRD